MFHTWSVLFCSKSKFHLQTFYGASMYLLILNLLKCEVCTTEICFSVSVIYDQYSISMRKIDNNMLSIGAKTWELTWCKKARVSTGPIFLFAGLVAPIKARLVPRQQLTVKVP